MARTRGDLRSVHRYHCTALGPQQPPRTAQEPPELPLRGWVAQEVQSQVESDHWLAGAARWGPLGAPVLKEQHSAPATATEVTGIRGSPGWGPRAGLIINSTDPAEENRLAGRA